MLVAIAALEIIAAHPIVLEVADHGLDRGAAPHLARKAFQAFQRRLSSTDG